MQRLLTGLQPSGALHIGNYLGAIRPFLEQYVQYESFMMVADYHALTTIKNGAELRTNILGAVKDYLAAGIDPKRAIMFQQSLVPEHTEFSWILQCLVTVKFLELAHAYKDKVAKGLEANAGLFAYPMLMASDILLYDTDVVPVGEDQRQHIEYAREAATKFNNAFGVTLREPKALITQSTGVVPGTDGRKMSKSYGNTIPLFASKDEIAKAVLGIVTDSSGDQPENVRAIHSFFRPANELESLYEQNRGNYKASKEALIEDIERTVAPLREHRLSISDDEVRSVLKEGSERAREIASRKMDDIRSKIGVSL